MWDNYRGVNKLKTEVMEESVLWKTEPLYDSDDEDRPDLGGGEYEEDGIDTDSDIPTAHLPMNKLEEETAEKQFQCPHKRNDPCKRNDGKRCQRTFTQITEVLNHYYDYHHGKCLTAGRLKRRSK